MAIIYALSMEYYSLWLLDLEQDNTTCAQSKGTGLGMAITKKYVDLMGGNIGIKSQKGVGSEFTVELPLELSTEKDIQERRVTSPDTDLTGIKVLIAEDNDLNAEIAVTLLEEQGLSVIRAVNGQEAADIFANSPQGTFDVILMDIMMPEMNGYDATRAIRSMSGRPDAAKKDRVLAQITQIMYSYNLTVDLATESYSLITGTGMERTVSEYKKHSNQAELIEFQNNIIHP